MGFLSKVELKKQLREMGIKVEGNYVKKSEVEKALAGPVLDIKGRQPLSKTEIEFRNNPKMFGDVKIEQLKGEGGYRFFTDFGEAHVNIMTDSALDSWADAWGINGDNLYDFVLVIDSFKGKDYQKILKAIIKFGKKDKFDKIYMGNPPDKTNPWKKLEGNIWQIDL